MEKWQQYEQKKRELKQRNLSSVQYEKELRKIIKELEL